MATNLKEDPIPRVGTTWRHHAGDVYGIVRICRDLQTQELCVVYRDLSGILIYPRIMKLKKWRDTVEMPFYTMPRFTPVKIDAYLVRPEDRIWKEELRDKQQKIRDLAPKIGTRWIGFGRAYQLYDFATDEDDQLQVILDPDRAEPDYLVSTPFSIMKHFDPVDQKEYQEFKKRARPDDDLESRKKLKVKRRDSSIKLPYRASKGAAGYDLFIAEDCTVPARGKIKTDLGLSFQIPEGYVGLIKIRSSLGDKCLETGAGVIDSDYRGTVSLILFNHSDADFSIKKDERISQLLVLRTLDGDIEEVDKLDSTERGDGGFGSTGRGAEEKKA